MLGYQAEGPTVPGWALLRVEPETRRRWLAGEVGTGASLGAQRAQWAGRAGPAAGGAQRPGSLFSAPLGRFFPADPRGRDGNTLPEMGVNLHIPCWPGTLPGWESSLLARNTGSLKV